MSEITVYAYRLGVDGSVSATGTAASAIDPSWSEVISEAGQGSVTFKNDDPILQVLEMDGRDLLQFRLDGTPAWVMWPDPAKIVSISQQEADGERTTLSGPGHLALLDRMRVYPGNGVGALPKPSERFWNWTTADFDDSAWVDSKVVADVVFAKTDWPEPWAQDFPLDICDIIWADNPLGGGSTFLDADEGTCWFRYPFTVSDEGIYRVFVSSDNTAEVYVDTVLITTSDSFTTTQQADFSMSAGTHILAIHGHNGAFITGLPSGPAGISLAVYEVTLAGLVLITYSFDGYQVLAYQDDPPGVTLGYAYGLYLAEGQSRGVLADLDWDFTDTLDSDGNAWAAVADISTGVNTSGLDFTRQLAAVYADFKMDPDLSSGLLLHAYRLGEMGGSSGVTLTRGGNLTSLEHQRENQPVTTLLIEGAEKWLERSDSAAVALYGRFESGLDAGAPASEAEVYRIADSQLDVFAHPREEISAGAVASIIQVGDTAVVPDSTGTSQAERCVGRTVTQDATNRQAILTYSFRDVILGEQERLVNIAKAGR